MHRLIPSALALCLSIPLRAQPIEDCPVSIACPEMSICTCTSEGREVVVAIDQFSDVAASQCRDRVDPTLEMRQRQRSRPERH